MSAEQDRELYEFYQRYLWGPVDFERFQDNVIGLQRDAMAELHAAGLLDGGVVSPGTGMQIAYAAFDAINDDGYLCVKESGGTVNLSAAHATLNRYDLIVARPLLEDNLMIARPEVPGDEVALTRYQHCQVVAIQGSNDASPSVPSKVAGDVILASVYIPATATSISGGDINQTTNHDIGRTVRFNSFTDKDVVVRARGNNKSAFTGYGHGSGNGLVGYGGASGSGVYGSGVYGGYFIGTTAGVTAEGPGDGTQNTDIALRALQNIGLEGDNPAITEPFTNMLTPMNLPKAWGCIKTTATNPTVVSGFNIDTNTANTKYDSPGGDPVLQVKLAAPMANTDGIIMVMVNQRSGGTFVGGAEAYGLWVDSQTIRLFYYSFGPADYLALDGQNYHFEFVIYAAQ